MATSVLIVLLAGSLVLVQIATLVLRRAVRDNLPYIAMLAATAAMLVFVHETKRHQSPESFLACVVALLLVFIPRLLESAELGALSRGDAEGALAWVKRRELLVPGRAVRLRRRSITSLVELQADGIAAVDRRLRAEIAALPSGPARAQIALELVSMLMLARRTEPALALIEAEVPFALLAKRAAIGAQVLAVLLDQRRLPEATRLLLALEAEDTATDPRSTALLTEARLLYLAHVGEETALVKLLDGKLGALFSDEARQQLLGVAVSAIARGETIDPVVKQVALGVAERVDEPFALATAPRPIVTTLLVAVNLACFAAVSTFLGLDDLALVRAGALFPPAIYGGEPWRLLGAAFLHAGWVHLAINVMLVWLLGRLLEAILGRSALFVTYLVAAFSASVASVLASKTTMSVGASGAVFGLIGALLTLLVSRAGRFSIAQRRMLIGNLLYLMALMLFLGLRFEVVDTVGHVGGLLGGALAAFVLRPGVEGSRRERVRGRVAPLLAALLLPGLLVTAFAPARRTVDATLLALPTRTVRIARYELKVPSHFVVDEKQGIVYDPFLGLELRPETKDGQPVLTSPQSNEPRLRRVIERAALSLRAIE